MVDIDFVLFDLDGVLVDACEWHYEALNMALKEHGYPEISRNAHESTYNGLPTRIKLQMMNVPKEIAEKINEEKQRHTIDVIRKNAILMSEKIELHQHLKSLGIKIACVTNSIRDTAIEMLTATGQIPFIDLIVTNEMVNRNKPYPDCYNLAIGKMNANPKKCICVEDSMFGLQAAKSSLAEYIWKVDNSTKVTKESYTNFVDGLYYYKELCRF